MVDAFLHVLLGVVYAVTVAVIFWCCTRWWL